MGYHMYSDPYSHGIAAIRKKWETLKDYVHKCYTMEYYMRAYEPAILHICARELWPKTNLPTTIPPKYKAQPRRPKKKRNVYLRVESKGENSKQKCEKKWEVKRCWVCGVAWHNKATCKVKKSMPSEVRLSLY